METGRPLAVLLVEDHIGDAQLIQELLWDTPGLRLTWVETLAAALTRLAQPGMDLVLLDLALPDSQGLATVARIVRDHPALPVIVLTGRDDDAVARAALTAGAKDYLVKGAIQPDILVRSVRYAYERKRTELALREGEARYRTMIETTLEGVWMLDAAGRTAYVNPQMTRMLGYTAEEMRGRTLADLLDAEVNESRDQHIRGRRQQHDLRLLRKDGSPVWVSRSSTPLMDERGWYVGALDMLSDITPRKQAEEALRKAHDALDQKVRERTTELSKTVEALTAEVARRVRAEEALRERSEQLRLLASELTLAEQRERRRVAEVLHGDLQQLLVGAKLLVGPLAQAADPAVRDAGREATDLILQAIQSSRSLTEELSPPILHRGGLVPALGWLARWMGEKHNLAVVVRVDGTPVVETEDTAVLCFQAVRELLFNAVKHAKVETAQVELARHEDQVQVIVADEGVGFDPTQLRVAGGTSGGFGLFSIHERLDLVGGRLEIESAPGQGSRFTLWVPAQRAQSGGWPAASAAGTEAVPGDVGGRRSGARKIRVLVVDDHLVVRQGFVRLLEEEPDLEVVGEASDGMSALTLTRQLVPDVVTMDIDLPGMNGIEATRRIHAEFPAVSVIGLSVFGEAEQAAAMRDAGAVEYLTKNGPSDALIAVIRTRGRPRREREG
jgi:PAS domain S-box-containing protein